MRDPINDVQESHLPAEKLNKDGQSSAFPSVSIAFSVLFLCALICHLFTVFAPWQLEYREGAVLFQIDGMLRGLDVYSRAQLPLYLNVYGSIYNSIGARLCSFLGESFMPLRLLSFFAIGASLLLFRDILKRHQVSNPVRMILCLIFYLGLLYFTTPLARPDALGLLLYMLCFWLFEVYPLGLPSLVAITAISLLAFLTKQYFIIIGPLVFSYILFFRSKAKGLVFCVLFTISFIVVYKIHGWLIPGYLPLTLAVNSGATPPLSIHTTLYMLRQTAEYGLVLSGGLVTCWLFQTVDRPRYSAKKTSMGFATYCTLLVFALMTLKLGHHTGAFLTYYFQLLSPFLLVALAPSGPTCLRLPRKTSQVCLVAVLVLVVAAMYKLVDLPQRVLRTGREIQAVAADALPFRRVLASPMLVAAMLRQNKQIYVSGQSIYLYAVGDAKALHLPGLELSPAAFSNIKNSYESTIADMIGKHSFDLVIRDEADECPDSWNRLLYENYAVKGTRVVAKRVETEWIPK